MEAQVKYSSGWLLVIYKYTNAPLLFLEWVSRFNAGQNTIHKIINDVDYIKIRLNCTKEQYNDCADYINGNILK